MRRGGGGPVGREGLLVLRFSAPPHLADALRERLVVYGARPLQKVGATRAVAAGGRRRRRRVRGRVAGDDQADDGLLEEVAVRAAEMAAEPFGEELRRQHRQRRVAEVEARDDRQPLLALRSRRRPQRPLRRQPREADVHHLELARRVERALHPDDCARHEERHRAESRAAQGEAAGLVLHDHRVGLAAVLLARLTCRPSLERVRVHLVHDARLRLHVLVERADHDHLLLRLNVERLHALDVAGPPLECCRLHTRPLCD